MGAGIHDRQALVIMRQVGIVLSPVKSKLQYLHSWETKGLPQGIDFRRDNTEVFSDQRQIAKHLVQTVK